MERHRAAKCGDLMAAVIDWRSIPDWFDKAYVNGDIELSPGDMNVRAAGQWASTRPDSWLICDRSGVLRVLDPDEFAQEYASVELAGKS